MTIQDGYYKVINREINDSENDPFRDGMHAYLKFEYDGDTLHANASVEDNWNGDEEAARQWMNTVKYLIVKDNDLEAVAVEV